MTTGTCMRRSLSTRRTLGVVFSALAILGAGPARAEDWAPYGRNEYFSAALDVDSVSVKGGGVVFWTKWSISKRGRAEMFDGKPRLAKSASTIKSKWQATCVGSDLGVAELSNYVFDAKGTLLESRTSGEPISFDLVPGTLMSDMHQAACMAGLAKLQGKAKAGASPPASGYYQKSDGGIDLKVTGKKIQFSINSVVGDHPCNLEGVATMIDGHRAAYSPESPSDMCAVVLAFAPGQVRVTTRDCDGYCGLNAVGSMDGVYNKH